MNSQEVSIPINKIKRVPILDVHQLNQQLRNLGRQRPTTSPKVTWASHRRQSTRLPWEAARRRWKRRIDDDDDDDDYDDDYDDDDDDNVPTSINWSKVYGIRTVENRTNQEATVKISISAPDSVQSTSQRQQQQQRDKTEEDAIRELTDFLRYQPATEPEDENIDDNQVTIIRYKKDQWSPINEFGEKCYDRDFLFCVQNNPISKKRPENLPDLEVVLKDNKSTQQRGPLPKCNKVVEDLKLDYKSETTASETLTVVKQIMSWDQVHQKLSQFFESNTAIDTIVDWISTNLKERVIENDFIRTLITAIVENSMQPVNNVLQLRSDIFQTHFLLLQRYLDDDENRQLQCLYALQEFVYKLEHLLCSSCEQMWAAGLLSSNSILAWSNQPAELPGKDIALKSMESLCTMLKKIVEADNGSSSSSEET